MHVNRCACWAKLVGATPFRTAACRDSSRSSLLGCSKRQAIADADPENADQGEGDHALHHGGENIFAANHAAIERLAREP